MKLIAVIGNGIGGGGALKRMLLLTSNLYLGEEEVRCDFLATNKKKVMLKSKNPYVKFEHMWFPEKFDQNLMQGSFFSKLSSLFLLVVFWFYQCFYFLINNYNVIIFRSNATGLLFLPTYLFFGRRIVLDLDDEKCTSKIMWISSFVCFKKSRVIVSQYHGIKNNFKGVLKSILESKVVAIVPGIDFHSPPSLPRLINDELVILQVGFICRRKNQLFSLTVLNDIVKRGLFTNIKFYIVGSVIDKNYNKLLKSYIYKNNLIDFVSFEGHSENIQDYYKFSHFVLLPSFSEGISNVMQEGMWNGCVVITSKAGGAPETIINNKDGFCLDIDSPKLWSEIIVDTCNTEKYNFISSNAHAKAKEFFTIKSWIENYQNIVDGLLCFEK